jgi:hypothetical protein
VNSHESSTGRNALGGNAFFRARSPDQMLATAAPWTSPWLPPGYEQNFWNAALGIEVKGVRVSAAGGFDTDTWKSTGIGYSVDVSSDVPADKIAHLLEVVDELAEIPRAPRAGATVPAGDLSRALPCASDASRAARAAA